MSQRKWVQFDSKELNNARNVNFLEFGSFDYEEESDLKGGEKVVSEKDKRKQKRFKHRDQ